jgi:hypothetical protein
VYSKTLGKKVKIKRLRHEAPWRPNNPGKKGKHGTLQKNLYKYKENPPRKLKRKKRGQSDKMTF